MQRILSSIKGRLLGMTHDQHLLAPKGIVLGRGDGGAVYGQSVVESPVDVAMFDDFHRFDTTDRWLATYGNDAGTPTGAILAGGIGGQLRFTTGNDGTLAADSCQITQRYLSWQASNGNLVFETRIKISAITQAYIYVGFSDSKEVALEAPIVSAASADTITTTATNAVGWMFDTRMTTDDWWLVGVADDVDATKQDSGYAPVAATWEVLRVSLSAAGVATFYRNGRQVGTAMSAAVAAGADLTPVIYVSTGAGTTAKTLDVDYVHVSMSRA